MTKREPVAQIHPTWLQCMLLVFIPLISGPVLSNEQWLSQDTPIVIEVPHAGPEKLAFYLGNTDISALFQHHGEGRYRYQSNVVPLPQGENELSIYQFKEGQWQALQTLPIKVLTTRGFEVADVNISGTLGLDSQWEENHKGDAPPPQRERFHDGSLQVSVESRHKRETFDLTTHTNLVGNTHRPKALSFPERQDDAPRVDLSDYLVDIKKGSAQLSLGHVNFTANPLLAPSIANRGFNATYRINKWIDIGGSAQNATGITGFRNVLGYRRDRHAVKATVIGIEAFPKEPSRMRLELSYVDANKLAENNFGVGEVSDAEKSSGWGVQLKGNEISGRLRYSLAFARNSFTNPEDPFLSQGLDLVAVKEDTASARSLEITYDLVAADYEKAAPTSFAVTIQHERTDPLYRSLTAFPAADQESSTINLNGAYGPAVMALGYQWQQDNLDDLPSVLKTKTRAGTLTLNVALGAWLDATGTTSRWWPELSLAANHVQQYAANQPLPADSDFNTNSHLPDQVNENANLGLTWSLDRWDLGYQFSYTLIDNRQSGRERADFRNRAHGLTVGYRPKTDLSLTLDWQPSRNSDLEKLLKSSQQNLSAGLDWRMSKKLSVQANLGRSVEDDSQNISESNSWSSDVSLSYRFSLPTLYTQKILGQAFLRYSRQRSQFLDNQFGFDSNSDAWTVSSGINISF